MDWSAPAPAATGKPWEMDWSGGQPAAPAPAGLTGADAMRARGLKTDPARQTEIDDAGVARIEFEQARARVNENPNFGRAASFTGGLPLIGEWTDQALGKYDPAAGERMSQMRKDFALARPEADQAGRLLGTIAGTVATAGAGIPSLIGKIPGLGFKMLAGGGAGAIAGGAEAASSAAGRADGGNRVEAAIDAAPLGAGLGAGVGVLAPAVATGASTALASLRGSDVTAIAKTLGISPKAAQAVKAAVGGEDMVRAGANLRRGGPDAMLVEGGPSLQALGKGTMASGGDATRIMRRGVDDRAAGAAAQMQGVLDGTLGKPAGRIDLAAGIRAATKKARGAAYDAAYATPIDYSSAAGRRIEELLGRLPAKTANAAIQKANERIAYDGGAKQIMASVGADGRVTFKEMPNAMQLDHLKRAFDKIVDDGTDAVTGKLSSDAQFASVIARDIRNAHAAANPAYRDALRTGMDSIQSEKAVETGYKALTVTPEVLSKSLSGLNKDARSAAKLGVRQYIEDQMSNVRAIMSRPGMNADVGEAMKAIKDLSSRRAQDNLALLVGKPEAGKLIGQLDELKTAFEIQAAMSRNSDTAVNQAVQKSIDGSTESGWVGKLMEGSPIQSTKRLTQLFTGATPEAREAAKAGIWAEIAKTLTSTRGAEAQRALAVVNQAMSGQRLTTEQAEAAGRLVATVLGAGAYREGTRALSPR
jgi:hypothetical protein